VIWRHSDTMPLDDCSPGAGTGDGCAIGRTSSLVRDDLRTSRRLSTRAGRRHAISLSRSRKTERAACLRSPGTSSRDSALALP
jgi:hypothetical protein